jgi:hypothetical protein
MMYSKPQQYSCADERVQAILPDFGVDRNSPCFVVIQIASAMGSNSNFTPPSNSYLTPQVNLRKPVINDEGMLFVGALSLICSDRD